MIPVLLFAPPALVSFDAAASRRADPTVDVLPETDAAVRRAARAALTRALLRYPAKPLLGCLRTVYVMRDVRAEGVAMGATNSPGTRTIWVSVGSPGQTPAWIETALHHEMAHLLADTRRSVLPEPAFRAANAPAFRYIYGAGGGFAAVQSMTNVDETLNPTLCASGPLSTYGATEFDEDWATYGERIVDPDLGFRRALLRFPRVRAKARLVAEFYRKVMPGIRLSTEFLTKAQRGGPFP